VNHVALVIDKSYSMLRHQETVIRVVDGFVKGLREESKERIDPATGRKLPRQETRISLYAFDHEVKCLVWDMSVEDLPSMRDVYSVDRGATSLIEATVVALNDLRTEVSEKYGSHAFLQITWSDGIENSSGCSETGQMHSSPDGLRVKIPAQLNKWKDRILKTLNSLPAHWTSAILVPSSLAKRKAQEYGFPAGNISTWDVDTEKGVEEAIDTMTAAASSFLRSRTADASFRGTKTFFSAVGQDLSVDTVKSVLEPLAVGSYGLYEVKDEEHDMEIRDFVEKRTKKPYRPRSAYYELGPRVAVQANKGVLVYMKKAGDDAERVYGGGDARELLFGADGRTNGTLSVKAGHNKDLKVLVMSGSYNRKVKKGTKLLVTF
jgi:hypothetical protein